MALDQAGLARTSALVTGGGSGIGLACAHAAWITGQNIGIDGGHALRRGPDLSGMLADVFGADGLRGMVGT